MRVKGWSGVSSVRPADNLKGISFSQILSLKINNYLAVLCAITQPASCRFRNCWVEFSSEIVALFPFSLSKMVPPGKDSTVPNVTNKKKNCLKGFF